jgi:hypothetical protein
VRYRAAAAALGSMRETANGSEHGAWSKSLQNLFINRIADGHALVAAATCDVWLVASDESEKSKQDPESEPIGCASLRSLRCLLFKTP